MKVLCDVISAIIIIGLTVMHWETFGLFSIILGIFGGICGQFIGMWLGILFVRIFAPDVIIGNNQWELAGVSFYWKIFPLIACCFCTFWGYHIGIVLIDTFFG